MNTVEMIFAAMGALMALTGLACLFTGKVYGMGASIGQYTDESLARYARPYGFAQLLIGAGIVVHNLVTAHLFTIGGINMSIGLTTLIACGVVGTIILIVSNKLLVKKAA